MEQNNTNTKRFIRRGDSIISIDDIFSVEILWKHFALGLHDDIIKFNLKNGSCEWVFDSYNDASVTYEKINDLLKPKVL